MIPAFVKSLGDTFNKSAGTTLAHTFSGVTSAGNLIVARVLFDNAATASKPVVSSISKQAGETANWVFLGAARSTSTSAGAFSSGEIWAIQTTVNWAADAYTVTLDTSVTMKAAHFQEFSGVQAVLRSTAGMAYSTTTTAASATTTGTTPEINDLALGFMFHSNATAIPSADTDTTGGSWSSSTSFGSTGGSAATNNTANAQYKVLTAGTHQTYNSSAALTAGNGAIVAILQSILDTSPKFETLTDDFSTNTIGSKWNGYGEAAVSGGVCNIPAVAGFAGIYTGYSYSLAESSIYAQLVPPPAGTSTASALFQLMIDYAANGTDLVTEINTVTSTISFMRRIDYTPQGTTVYVPYDPATHLYFRIRETGGTTYWETSADAVTWTVHRSESTWYWVTANPLRVHIGTWRNDGAGAGAIADYVNVAPPPKATLKGEWGFLDNLNDTSGNGNHAVASSYTPSYVTGPQTNTKAIQFTGTGQRVNLGLAGIDPTSRGVSHMGWVKFTVAPPASYFSISSRAISGVSTRYGNLTYNGLASPRARWTDDLHYTDAGPDVKDGNWHHLAVVDGDHGWAFYVDGVRFDGGTRSVTGTGHADTGLQWGIGNVESGSLTESVNGACVSGVRIFHGELTDAEVVIWMNTPIVGGGGGALTANVTDTVGLSDSITLTVAKAVGDTVGITDVADDAISHAHSDSVGVTDSVTFAKAASASDSVGITDSVTPVLTPAPTGLTVDVSDSVWSGQSYEPFTTYPIQEWAEGNTYGAYRAVFNSAGLHGVVDDGTGNRVVRQQPEFVSGDTRASLSVTTTSFKNVDVTMQIKTVSQNRPTAPNTWERAWAVAAYVDNDWFYYVTLKTNGLEVGKRDPAYPGGQRFLPWYQSTNWPLGSWNKVRIKLTEVPTGTMIQVWVDDVLQTSYWGDASHDYFIDEERPLNLGAIGFYNEDALVHFDDVAISGIGLPVDSATFGVSKAATDSVGITDTATDAVTLNRVEVAGITDVVSGAGQGAVGLTDTVGLTDSVTTALAVARDFTDPVGLTDSVSGTTSLTCNLTDSVGVTDSVTEAATRGLADTVGLTDSIATTAVVVRSYSDQAGLVDTATTAVVAPRGDTENLSDSLSVVGTFGRSTVDLAGVTDSIAITKSSPGDFADLVTLTDYIARAAAYFRAYTDPVGLTDSVVFSGARALADTLALTDLILRGLGKDYADLVGLTDTIGRGHGRGLAELVGITDSCNAVLVGAAGGRPDVWTGTAWVEKPGKVWTGAAWPEKPWKRWTGTAWENV